jgi:hypothetical protein
MVIQDHIWANYADKRVIVPLGNLKYSKVSPFVFESNSLHGRCISNRPPSTCIHLALK